VWASYTQGSGASFTEFKQNHGYWFLMGSAGGTLNYSDNSPIQMVQILNAGWALASFNQVIDLSSNEDVFLEENLKSTHELANIKKVWGYGALDGGWKFFVPSDGTGTLESLPKGYAFWFLLQHTVQFSLDSSTPLELIPTGAIDQQAATSAPLVVSTISGTVSDGPIRNARVSVDLNYDGVFSPGEPFDISDENGNFEISYVFENDTEYLLIAEGSDSLGTVDPADNADLGTLNFVMYNTVTTVQSQDVENYPIVKAYSKDMNPATFQDYLQELDHELLGGLDTASTEVSKLLTADSSDTTKLFRENIVNTASDSALKSVFTSKLAKVAQLIESKEEGKESNSTKTELELATDNLLVFSEEATEELTEQLAFANKTTPNKIGDLVVTSQLNQVGATDELKVFVTPYRSIMDITDYAQIRNLGMTALLGADVVIKDGSGKRVTGVVNSSINNTIINSLNFEDIDSLNFQALDESNVSYLTYGSSGWTEVTGALSIGSNQINGILDHLIIAPLILARKSFLQDSKTISVPGYSDLTNPVVIVKGHWVNPEPFGPALPPPLSFTNGSIFKNLEGEGSLHLDLIPLSGTSISVRIPTDFTIDELVIISKDIAGIDAAGKISLNIKIENDTVSSEGGPQFVFIEDDQLKSLLLAGSGLESYAGLDSFIETRIPYEILRLFFEKSPTGTEAISSTQMFLANAQNFLSGNSTFSTQGISSLNWDTPLPDGTQSSFTFTVNESKEECTLTESNQDSGANPVFTRTITWRFFESKVEKKVSSNHSGGRRKGSTNSQTITFDRNDREILSAVFEDSRKEVFISASGYKSVVDGFYKGSAIFDRASDFDVDEILSAKYEQSMTQTLTFNNQILGGVNSVEGFLEMGNTHLKFEGDFQVYLETYGTIVGKVALKGNAFYARGFDYGFYNNNLLGDAVFTAQSMPQNQSTILPVGIEGQWSGALADSCGSDGLISLQVTQSNQIFQAQSAD
ncbi:hypothetical protein HOF92_11085, partial [bacterium]|nr:hypothetical protein [bacterium]